MRTVGIGTRSLNFLVDTILIFILSYAIFKWYSFYVYYYAWYPYQYYLWFFATIFMYYFLFEAVCRRTPGKFLTMSEVVGINGKKPALHQIFLRSVLRLTLIDAFFIPIFSKPLHDFLSKTSVVEVD